MQRALAVIECFFSAPVLWSTGAAVKMLPHINTRSACSSVSRVAFASLVAAVCVHVGCSVSPEIDARRCVVWGPGLSPDAVLPVRYFYIQSVDSEGHNLSASPGERYTNICWKHLSTHTGNICFSFVTKICQIYCGAQWNILLKLKICLVSTLTCK